MDVICIQIYLYYFWDPWRCLETQSRHYTSTFSSHLSTPCLTIWCVNALEEDGLGKPWAKRTFLKPVFAFCFSSPVHEVLGVSYCDRSVVSLFTITKKSCTKLTIIFQSNFTEIILRSCSFKILQRIEFPEELQLPWQRSEKTLKIFLSQTVRARAFIFGM